MLLSMLIEEYVCKKFQDYDPLNKALLGIYMERKDRSAKGKLGGSGVIKFLQDHLEPEPGNSNHCLAQVSPIS